MPIKKQKLFILKFLLIFLGCYHLKEKTQVPAAVLQKAPSIFNDVPEEESIPVSFQIPHAGGEKYILMQFVLQNKS